MPAYSAARSRPCAGQRLSVAFQAALDSHLRIVRPEISAVVQTQTEQPALCFESRRLVRAGASGRRFCRDFCRVVAATLELAPSLSGLARAAEARICR